MKTKLIKIDNYWIVVEDKRIENPKITDIILDEYNEVGNFVDLSHLGLGYGNMKKLIASQNPDHKLPNITFSEEIAKELGEVDIRKKAQDLLNEAFKFDNSVMDDTKSLLSDFYNEGYNQCKEDNKEKKYTEADIGKAWEAGYKKAESKNKFENPFASFYIQSLPKQKYNVEIEMDRIPADQAPNGWDVFPKITNNSITIIKLLK